MAKGKKGSPKKGKRDPHVYEQARERDEGCCQWPMLPGKEWPEDKGMICGNWGVEVHHRRYRSQGGKDTLDNLICLCPAHHKYAHSSLGEACEKGVSISPKYGSIVDEYSSYNGATDEEEIIE